MPRGRRAGGDTILGADITVNNRPQICSESGSDTRDGRTTRPLPEKWPSFIGE